MKTTFKLLPMLAIVAGIAFSAFTSAKPSESKNKVFANYFWYPVNPTTGLTNGPALNPSTAVSKADAMAALTECEDETSECLRGSANNSLPTGSNITVVSDNRIRNTQP